MLVKGSIGLGIRERKPVTNADKYSARTVGRWLTNLPKANIGETSRQIYGLLNDSNKEILTADQRTQLLDKLHETVSFITQAMKKHYMGMSVSLSEKQQKIANFTQALDVEMAIGYKTIIEDLLVDEKYQSKLLINAVNICMHYFYLIQTRSYLLYRDLPKGMWHEIHLLFQLAEQNQFHDKKVLFANRGITILGTYKKILLLATVNPNQLRQQETDQIAELLGKAAQMTRLDSDPTGSHDFVVNLSSDSAPFHSSLLRNEMTAHYRGISLAKVVETLEIELKDKSQEQRMFKIDDHTQKHLLGAWGDMATRTFARVDGEGKLQVTVGLSASHFIISDLLYGIDEPIVDLSGEKLIDSLEGSLKDAVILDAGDEGHITRPGKRVRSNNIPKPKPAHLQENSMWDAMYRNRSVQSTESSDRPYQFMEQTKNDNPSLHNTQEATVINISPGGFCLELNTPLPKQTQTGEIIGLMEHGSDGEVTWNIGTIRWMRRKHTGELEIGVQLIAPNAEPIKAQLRNSHSDDNLYQRSLKLPAIEGIGQPETLLTSPLPFREQAKVRIQTHEGTQDVLLISQIDSGLSYKQFTFEMLDTDPDGDMKDNYDDFDAVWKLI